MKTIYKTKLNWLMLWLILSLGSAYGQNKEPLRITQLEITGLNKTKVEYLSRFIKTKVGDTLQTNQLQADRQSLINLEAIAEVKIQFDTVAEGIALNYEINEALTFFPIINFGGVRGNFWYQLGFTDANWAGKGIKLTTFYQNIDGRDNFSFHYRNPFIKGNRWGASLSFVRFASIEPLFFPDATVFYDYENTSYGATGIFQANERNSFELGATYFIERYNKNERHEGEVTPGPDFRREPKMLGKFLHRYNKINYHYHQLSGFDNVLNFQTVYNLEDYSLFHILINNTRYFKRIGPYGNLAARLRLGLSTNNDSPFAPFVLDSYVNIRGSGNRIDRGTAAVILNLEYRHTVYNRGRFVGQLVAFSDAGTWRKPGGDIEELINGETLRHFVGGGFRITYTRAHNATFRLDYGIDIQDRQQRGVVVGVGQYF